jgi:hypothetical protein
MAIPAEQVAHASKLLKAFCAKVPERVRHLVEHDFVVGPQAIVLLERRPHFERPSEWLTHEVAKFRFVKRHGFWVLYWPDRNGKWHEYEGVSPVRGFEVLLREVERDPTCIFWG